MSERPTGYQYTLVVGPDSPDRAWLESVLMRGGLEVAACNEAELLAMPDASGAGGTLTPVPPGFVVPEYEGDQRDQQARQRHQAGAGQGRRRVSSVFTVEANRGSEQRKQHADHQDPTITGALEKLVGDKGKPNSTDHDAPPSSSDS